MFLKPIEQSFNVSYSYSLHFTKGIFDTENSLLKDVVCSNTNSKGIKILFVVDTGLLEANPTLLEDIKAYGKYYHRELSIKEIIVSPGGESAKNNADNVDKILQGINENAICRHSYVIIIGGGAVIDMAGYASTIAHRGVRHIRIPTTVLSQNDAAVGVKNGINAFNKKNFVGTFAVPDAIINDIDFLTTLEQRDWIAGISEALKVALIKDANFYKEIKERAEKLKNRDKDAMLYTIYRCAEMHMEHIAKGGDPFESGSSRPLDFGHWAAHKLEDITNYELRHGEAVAKGIALDLTYAYLMSFISKEVWTDVLGVMQNIGFDLSLPVSSQKERAELLKGIEEFREHLGGELTITLIDRIGSKVDVHSIDLLQMEKAITLLNKKVKIKVV